MGDFSAAYYLINGLPSSRADFLHALRDADGHMVHIGDGLSLDIAVIGDDPMETAEAFLYSIGKGYELDTMAESIHFSAINRDDIDPKLFLIGADWMGRVPTKLTLVTTELDFRRVLLMALRDRAYIPFSVWEENAFDELQRQGCFTPYVQGIGFEITPKGEQVAHEWIDYLKNHPDEIQDDEKGLLNV